MTKDFNVSSLFSSIIITSKNKDKVTAYWPYCFQSCLPQRYTRARYSYLTFHYHSSFWQHPDLWNTVTIFFSPNGAVLCGFSLLFLLFRLPLIYLTGYKKRKNIKVLNYYFPFQEQYEKQDLHNWTPPLVPPIFQNSPTFVTHTRTSFLLLSPLFPSCANKIKR